MRHLTERRDLNCYQQDKRRDVCRTVGVLLMHCAGCCLRSPSVSGAANRGSLEWLPQWDVLQMRPNSTDDLGPEAVPQRDLWSSREIVRLLELSSQNNVATCRLSRRGAGAGRRCGAGSRRTRTSRSGRTALRLGRSARGVRHPSLRCGHDFTVGSAAPNAVSLFT